MSYLLVLLPILYQLKSPLRMISLGELLLMPFILYYMVRYLRKHKGHVIIPKGLLAFYFIPVFLCLLSVSYSYFSLANALTVVARIIYYCVLIIVSTEFFDLNKGIRLYYYLSIAIALYLIAQIASHYFIGVDLPIMLNFPNILFSPSGYISANRYYSLYGFRPASVFTEPSYYADYMMPIIIILLFSRSFDSYGIGISYKKRTVSAVFLSISVLLTTSSLGVVYVLLTWGIFVFLPYSDIRIKKTVKLAILLTSVILFVWILNNSLFSTTINRFMSGSSVGARLFRGFIIFDQLDWKQKLCGIGLNNIGEYVSAEGIKTIYDENNINYTVTLTNRLVATGMIGTLSLIYFWLVQFLSRKSGVAKSLLLGLLVSFAFANGEYTFGFPFVFIWVMSFDKIERKVKGSYSKQ